MKDRSKISLDKEKIGAPMSVPEGYFVELEDQVLAKTANKKRVILRPWVKYSIAASMVLFMGLYVVFKTSNTRADINLSEVNGQDRLEYLEDVSLYNEDIIEVVTYEELEWLEENLMESTSNNTEFEWEGDFTDEELFDL